MNNKESAKSFLLDARIIFEEAAMSFEKGHWHRVVRKCQEVCELSVKGLFKYLTIEYPKSHLLGRVIKKELRVRKIFSREELNKIAFISDELAFDREAAFYGSPEGIPAALFLSKKMLKNCLKKQPGF